MADKSKNPEGKSPSESVVKMTELVLPTHTNNLGTIFGGQIMAWIDIAAAIAAGKHSKKQVVTASFDAIHFIAPVKQGHVVHIYATVNYAARTSMEVGIRVDSEDWMTQDMVHNATAYATFVALDSDSKPTSVPKIIPKTEEEKRRFDEAKKRREARIAAAKDCKTRQTK